MDIGKAYDDNDILKHLEAEKDLYGVLFLLLYYLTVGIFCLHAKTMFASKSKFPYMDLHKLSLTYGGIMVIGVSVIINRKESCTYYIFYKGVIYSIKLANLDFMLRIDDLRWLDIFELFMDYAKEALEGKGFHV